MVVDRAAKAREGAARITAAPSEEAPVSAKAVKIALGLLATRATKASTWTSTSLISILFPRDPTGLEIIALWAAMVRMRWVLTASA